MKFSVVGLPHYTIWHLYEPSVDDLRHMEEMEQERILREQEEKERAEQQARQQDLFQDPKEEWKMDDAALRDILEKEKPESKPVKEGEDITEEGEAASSAKPSKVAVDGAGIGPGVGAGVDSHGEQAIIP